MWSQFLVTGKRQNRSKDPPMGVVDVHQKPEQNSFSSLTAACTHRDDGYESDPSSTWSLSSTSYNWSDDDLLPVPQHDGIVVAVPRPSTPSLTNLNRHAQQVEGELTCMLDSLMVGIMPGEPQLNYLLESQLNRYKKQEPETNLKLEQSQVGRTAKALEPQHSAIESQIEARWKGKMRQQEAKIRILEEKNARLRKERMLYQEELVSLQQQLFLQKVHQGEVDTLVNQLVRERDNLLVAPARKKTRQGNLFTCLFPWSVDSHAYEEEEDVSQLHCTTHSLQVSSSWSS